MFIYTWHCLHKKIKEGQFRSLIFEKQPNRYVSENSAFCKKKTILCDIFITLKKYFDDLTRKRFFVNPLSYHIRLRDITLRVKSSIKIENYI